jgi:hypothetical protein
MTKRETGEVGQVGGIGTREREGTAHSTIYFLAFTEEGQSLDYGFRSLYVLSRVVFEHSEQDWQRSRTYFLFSHRAQ